jgi:hypothetical protein
MLRVDLPCADITRHLFLLIGPPHQASSPSGGGLRRESPSSLTPPPVIPPRARQGREESGGGEPLATAHQREPIVQASVTGLGVGALRWRAWLAASVTSI